MANMKVKWTLPTARKSGAPLPVNQIAKVVLEIAVEGGQFAPLDEFAPTTLETTVTELDPGGWQVRGTVFDTAGRASLSVVASIILAPPVDPNDPPGVLTLVLGAA